jgi:hypothetical protein
MRKFLLLAAALALAPTAAPASTQWEANSRRCAIDRWFTKGEGAFEYDTGRVLVVISPEDIPALEKGIALLKHCDKFWSCVRKRSAGEKRRCRIPKK